MKKRTDYRKLWDYVLEDDDTPVGGVSYVGETLRDFMISVGLDENSSLEKINKTLTRCGIKPICYR